MSKTKQKLWTKFGGKEFFARMAENAKNDADGNEITQTYATKDVATTSADGLMSSADKTKLNGLETGAEVNVIEGITVNGTALSPDPNKNVDIPLATRLMFLKFSQNIASYWTISKMATVLESRQTHQYLHPLKLACLPISIFSKVQHLGTQFHTLALMILAAWCHLQHIAWPI